MEILQINEQPLLKKELKKKLLNNSLHLLEKRIRKQIRMSNLVDKNMVLFVADPLTEFFLKRIITLPITIKKISAKELGIIRYDDSLFTNSNVKLFLKKMKKNEKLFLPLLMDDYCVFFLKGILKNKKQEMNRTHKIYSFFETISFEEIMPLVERNKIKINLERSDADGLYASLDKLEQKFLGTKHGLYRSYLFYKNNQII